jgi:hypothetical protein
VIARSTPGTSMDMVPASSSPRRSYGTSNRRHAQNSANGGGRVRQAPPLKLPLRSSEYARVLKYHLEFFGPTVLRKSVAHSTSALSAWTKVASVHHPPQSRLPWAKLPKAGS